jgi:hypothetical protein
MIIEVDSIKRSTSPRPPDSRLYFGPEQGVSPKWLSPDQKVRRWRALWFADVLLNIEGSF